VRVRPLFAFAFSVAAFSRPCLAMVDCERIAPCTASAKRTYTVAAIGDSLTDVRVGGGRYLGALARRCPLSRFDAYGVGGQRTNHMRWRFLEDVFGVGAARRAAKPAYTHVIVLGGINDLSAAPTTGVGLHDIQRNLTFMYQAARARGVKVVALTLPPWGYAPGRDLRPEVTRLLNRWILSLPTAGAVDFAVDIHPLLSCGDADALCDRFRIRPDDAVHWNEAGHEVVAEALVRAVFGDCQ